jgi:hypothetical protein
MFAKNAMDQNGIFTTAIMQLFVMIVAPMIKDGGMSQKSIINHYTLKVEIMVVAETDVVK